MGIGALGRNAWATQMIEALLSVSVIGIVSCLSVYINDATPVP